MAAASWIFYIVLLAVTFCIGIFRGKKLSQADRWICLLLFITIIQEFVARYYQVYRHNNLITYQIYTPIELSIIIFYFNSSLKIGRSPWFEILTFCMCVGVAAINARYFQPIDTWNSYYLMFEGCFVIGLCLLSFYRLLIREEVIPTKMAHFWFIICFLFYSSLTYANFGLYSEQIKIGGTVSKIFNLALSYSNYLFYLGIATVFLRYKKLIPSGD